MGKTGSGSAAFGSTRKPVSSLLNSLATEIALGANTWILSFSALKIWLSKPKAKNRKFIHLRSARPQE
jgi:hypothetical protein